MSIKNKFPNIKPSLNLDFANTKQLDPRITFTRASTATYWDGKTFAKAEENLLKYSQDFSNEVWTKLTGVGATQTVTQNYAIAPDGTMTATRVQMTLGGAGSYSEIQRGFTPRVGEQYTYSVYLKSLSGAPVVDLGCYNNLYAQNKVTVTTEWVRYTFTWTATASINAPGLLLYTASSTANSADILVWGAQLEQRSQATAYTPTTDQPITKYQPVLQTAASGAARFDHNPVTGESLGLLIEEQRTNLLTYSGDLSGASLTAGSRAVNALVAPDGSLSASIINGTGGATASTWVQSATATAATMTFSCYLKTGLPSSLVSFTFLLRNTTTGTDFSIGSFNQITGAIIGAGWSSAHVGNGWYRISYTNQASEVITVGNVITCYLGAGGGTIYPTSAALCIWGIQLEAGAFPTSYIPTTTAQVTRAADAASMTGTNFSSWYRQDEGTIFCESSSANGTDFGETTPSAADSPVSFGNSLTNQFQPLVVNNTSSRVRYASSYYRSPSQALTPLEIASNNSYPGGVWIKFAVAMKTGDYARSILGGQAVGSTQPESVIGGRLVIGGNYTQAKFNGHIKKLAYYPKRLSNTELQALTA